MKSIKIVNTQGLSFRTKDNLAEPRVGVYKP